MMFGPERDEERGDDMGGNVNLRRKNVTREGWRVRARELIKEIEVQVGVCGGWVGGGGRKIMKKEIQYG